MDFNYVNVINKGCEGWLNLFFGDNCIALVRDIDTADEIRKVTRNRQEVTFEKMDIKQLEKHIK